MKNTLAILQRKLPIRFLIGVLLSGLLACSSVNQPSLGTQKKLRLSVGGIKEVSLPVRGDGGSELIGTSDNQEVVDVSRRQLALANSSSAIFQIKGITVGTASVVFSTKPLNQAGSGQPIRTYVVKVTAK